MTEDLGSGGTTTVATLTAATAPEDDALEAPGSGAGASGSGRDANAHGLAFPAARVKKMMRERSDVKTISVDAVFLVAQAAEMFVQQLAERSLDEMLKDDTRKKTEIEYKDIAAVVHSWDTVDFLRGPVPQKVLASTVLADLQQGQLAQQ